MKKTLLILVALVACLALVAPAMACVGSQCGQVSDEAHAGAEFGFPAVVKDLGMGWTVAGGDGLVLEGHAYAQGKDKYFFIWKTADGKAFASAVIDGTTLKAVTKMFTTGEQHETGLPSITAVTGLAILDYNATALATGNIGCLQEASVALSGDLKALAGGYALASGPNGSGSVTEAVGTTTATVSASDSESKTIDFDVYWLFGCIPIPIQVDPVAEASIDGKIVVAQSLFTVAYVSPDGQTTKNFGMISGGNALSLGDANITGMTASGTVSQSAVAVGAGAVAYGNSAATYENAGGQSYNGCISIGQADGLAVVTGYNNVTNTGDTLTVTSHQTAYSTTGGPGYGGPQ